jgi:hypothetical protein
MKGKDIMSDILDYIKENRVDNKSDKILYYLKESKVTIEESFNKNEAILGRVKVVLMEVNTKSQNGTFYGEDWYEAAIAKNQTFQERLKKKLVLGELDHPDKPGTSGTRTAFALIKIWREGNTVYGVLEVFNTTVGKDLWTLICAGVVIGFSLRGVGSDYYENGVMKIEPNGFELKGWDAVTDPSFVTAEFKEMVESKKESILKTLNENLDQGSVSRMILENINKEIKEEKISKHIIFENTQLKELDKKNKLIVEDLNKTITNLQTLINESKKSNDVLGLKVNEFNEIVKQKQFMIESKQKTNDSLSNEKVQLENKISLLNAELEDKKVIVEKLKQDVENLKNFKPINPIEVFVHKINESKENKNGSSIIESIKSRQYEVK